MTPREEKTAAIKAITDQQIELIINTSKMAKRWKYRPAKRGSTTTKRFFKMLSLGFKISALGQQKKRIINQPITPAWFRGGCEVGQSDEILISKSNETVMCPNINTKVMDNETTERLLRAIKQINA